MATAEAPYLRIAAEIEGRIRSGALAPGDRVPSTRQITRDYGIAIATATKVLAELADRGAVTAIPGVGTVVAAPGSAAPPTTLPSGSALAMSSRSIASAAGRASRSGTSTAGPAPGSITSGTGPGPAKTVGTPVSRAGGGRGHTKASAGPAVNRARIIAAAIDVADSEGIGAVTMRRLAVDLGVATMSLYHWISSKDDLVVGMIDTLMGADAWPAVPPEGWRAQLEFVARRQWRGYLAHPWLAQVVSLTRPQLAPGAMMHTEWVLRALAPHRLPPGDQIYVVLTLFGHVKSVAIGLEQEQQAERDTGLDIDEWFEVHDDEFTPHIQSGRYPSLAAIDGSGDGFEFDLATLFEFGLTIVLDGIADLLRRH